MTGFVFTHEAIDSEVGDSPGFRAKIVRM